jgi:hypothetical protein
LRRSSFFRRGERIDHIDHTGFVDGNPGTGPVDEDLSDPQLVGTQVQTDSLGLELGQGDEVFGMDAIFDSYIVDAEIPFVANLRLTVLTAIADAPF